MKNFVFGFTLALSGFVFFYFTDYLGSVATGVAMLLMLFGVALGMSMSLVLEDVGIWLNSRGVRRR